MGGIGIDLLPGDSELARRAAGGDGAAFVRLYDHYSADVFEDSLAATGSVEKAADATQIAFLQLLRRPPAIDAPDSEVVERLRTTALGPGVEAAPLRRRTAEGTHAPRNAGAGWLRSETVAKAGAQFDDDWSKYLSATTPAAAPADLTDPPLAAAAAPLAASSAPGTTYDPVYAVSDGRGAPPDRSRRHPGVARDSRVPLPSRASLATLLLLALFAAALAVVLTGESEEDAPQRPAPSTANLADADHAPERAEIRRTTRRAAKRGIAPGRPMSPRELRAFRRAVARSGGDLTLAAFRRSVARSRRGFLNSSLGGSPAPRGGAPLRRRGGAQADPRPSDPVDSAPPPAATDPPPPTNSPAPAERSEPTPPPGPEPAPTAPAAEKPPAQGNGGVNRNCNSKKSSNPC